MSERPREGLWLGPAPPPTPLGKARAPGPTLWPSGSSSQCPRRRQSGTCCRSSRKDGLAGETVHGTCTLVYRRRIAVAECCFLCAPDPELLYARKHPFYAMLGLGAIVEGYSIIATTAHVTSMLDISLEEAGRLVAFQRYIRALLRPHYGEVIITEHGRVPTCDSPVNRPEAHCHHAHRLVFPVRLDLADSLHEYGLRLEEYPDPLDARTRCQWAGEYLYFERIDGSCVVAPAPTHVVRQFFRYKIAEAIGRPELSDWVRYPQSESIEAAKMHLKGGAKLDALD